MKLPVKYIFFIFIIQVFSCRLYAWSKESHKIIAEIADAHLTHEVRQSIREIVGLKKTLGSVAVWADQIKAKFPRSRPYHYMNIPIQEAEVNLKDYRHEVNVYSALKSNLKILEFVNTTPKQKKEALKWVVHLMGDMHQPLHVGDNKDQGGNRTIVVFDKKINNLHNLWDASLVNHYYKDTKILQHEIMTKIRPLLAMEHYGRGDIEGWLLETHALARDCYSVGAITIDTKDTLHLPDSYGTKSLLTIKLQLKKAGLRLATVLNKAFTGDLSFSSFKYIYSTNSKIFHAVKCKKKGTIKPVNTRYSDVRPYNKKRHEYCVKATKKPARKPIKKMFVKEDIHDFERKGYIKKSTKKLTEDELDDLKQAQQDFRDKLKDAEAHRQSQMKKTSRAKKTPQDSIIEFKADSTIKEAKLQRKLSAEKVARDSVARLAKVKADSTKKAVEKVTAAKNANEVEKARLKKTRQDSLAKLAKVKADSTKKAAEKAAAAAKAQAAKAAAAEKAAAKAKARAAAAAATANALAAKNARVEKAKKDSLAKLAKVKADSAKKAAEKAAAAKKAQEAEAAAAAKAKADSTKRAAEKAAAAAKAQAAVKARAHKEKKAPAPEVAKVKAKMTAEDSAWLIPDPNQKIVEEDLLEKMGSQDTLKTQPKQTPAPAKVPVKK